jgi:hypothetical protein
MNRYEFPELLEVGSVENVVLGTKNDPREEDDSDGGLSSHGLSVLDVD